MSQIALEQSLLKAIDDYIDNSTNVNDMQQIAHSFNMLPTISSKMRICFYSLLSDLDHTRIKKTLDMLEYLTIFSPPKVLQIINDDKFMENMAQALMEYYLQDQALNLLRLWIDEFSDSQEEIKLVKALAENLEPFEILLPASYHSKYKSAAAAGESVVVDIGDDPIERAPEAEPIKAPLPSKVSVLVNKAKEVMDNITRFLESPDFESLSQEDKRKKLHLLMAQNLEVTSDFSDLKIPSYEYDAIEKIEEEVEKLKNCRIKLHERLDHVQRGGISPQSQQQPQPQSNNDSYKIVVSETDKNEDSNEGSNPRLMELEELLSYKTQMCEAGAVCNHAPVQGKRVSNHTLYTNEMHCPGWHNPADRRRPVYNDNYRSMYNFIMCEDRDTCMLNDACGYSHNFFECAYHPMHYKKKKCRFSKTCKNGKYCPDYHTTEEKEAWDSIAKQYFESISEGNSMNNLGDDPLGDDPQNVQEITSFKHQGPSPYAAVVDPQEPPGFDDVQQSSLTHHESESHQTGPVYGRSSFGKNFPRFNPNAVGFRKYQEPEEPAQPKGTLHSKLVIRKKYEEPGTLTSFFQKSPIFGSFPFVSGSPSVAVEHAKAQNNENGQEESEEI